MSTRRRVLGTALGLLLGGCGRSPTTASNDGSGVRAAVTTEVSRYLTPEGKFILPPATGGERALLAQNIATELAINTARHLGRMVRPALEAQHQGKIDFDDLSLCGDVYFAHTPFESVPQGLSPSLVYFLGSRWIVGICSGGQPAISVVIAANATETHNTRLGLFGPAGSTYMVGIPPGWDGAIPISAENAAIFAASRTKRQLSSVPVLYAPNPLDAFAQGATWVFDVSGDIAVHGEESGIARTGHRFGVGTEHVGADPMLRGSTDLYMSKSSDRRILSIPGEGGGGATAELRVRSGAWIDRERAIITKEGNSP